MFRNHIYKNVCGHQTLREENQMKCEWTNLRHFVKTIKVWKNYLKTSIKVKKNINIFCHWLGNLYLGKLSIGEIVVGENVILLHGELVVGEVVVRENVDWGNR